MTASATLPPLTFDVLLFASLAEAFGTPALTVTLGPGATAGELRDRVLADPRAPLAAAQVRVAVNQTFAAADHPLRAGDEVALIPPVAGG
jgi:molybdopterin synthase sulfur carrier subunit